jgi:hypothetical protein
MFRRSFRKLNDIPLDPALIPLLAQANQLSAAGQAAQAAPLYLRLAEIMENRRHPRRAANFHAMAAHAYAEGQDESQALAQAQAALRLFTEYHMVERAPRFFTNISHKLQAHGMNRAAETLKQEFSGLALAAPGPVEPEQHRRLPLACPKCGAPARSDEVTWVDQQTAQCTYCGTLMSAE